VQLLENGQIPYRKVGTRRRVLFENVMGYKNDIKEKRRKVLAHLTSTGTRYEILRMPSLTALFDATVLYPAPLRDFLMYMRS
jgi:hypothetical protein